MSGQWEVVGRKKGKDNPINKKLSKEVKKNSVPYTPKIEDVLPLKQVKQLYNNKENKKPQEKDKQKNDQVKKVQKKEETHDVPKPKPPKTIESALNSINVEEFKSVFETNKRLFPDAPIVWLKQLSQFLNLKVPIEIQDCTFASRPETYPFLVVPPPLKAVIEQSLKEAGNNNAQLFFDISLTAMANDMSKNLPALGHKIYIQCLALNYPNFALSNLQKYTTLRVSYQNRQNIGLSILWALGQVGVKSLQNGLKVFQEIFLPVVEMKSFSKYVIQYLIALIKKHQKGPIDVEQYLLVLDIAFASYKNFPNDLKNDLLKSSESLAAMLLASVNSDKYHVLIEPLLKKLQSNNNLAYKKQICDVLVACLSKDKNAFGFWSKCYTSCVSSSALLLEYIDANWATLSSKFKNAAFKNLLNSYSVTNEELKVKRKKELGLAGSIAVIEKLKEKMAIKRDFNFLTNIIIAAAIASIVYMCYTDIQQSGSWQASRTREGLRKTGILHYSRKLTSGVSAGSEWVHEKLDEQFPGYYETTAGYVQPYVQLSQDLGLIFSKIFVNIKESAIQSYPAVRASIESYAPGFIEGSQQLVIKTWDGTKYYFYQSIEYIRTEVFVGKLAPENIQTVLYETYDVVHQRVVIYYNWVIDKIQLAIK